MIGLLGGTFDPIHFAHLRCALEVRQDCDLDQIRFIPCRQPPHRDPPFATPVQRLAMLRLALNGQAGFEIDERELHREGPSYTVDTLEAMRREVSSRPLCLLLGMDAFARLDGWHRWQELIELAHIIVMQRPVEVPAPDAAVRRLMDKHMTQDPKQLRSEPAGRIYMSPVTQINISASRIRELIALGRSPRYLLPDPVLGYIRSERLYLDAGVGVRKAGVS